MSVFPTIYFEVFILCPVQSYLPKGGFPTVWKSSTPKLKTICQPKAIPIKEPPDRVHASSLEDHVLSTNPCHVPVSYFAKLRSQPLPIASPSLMPEAADFHCSLQEYSGNRRGTKALILLSKRRSRLSWQKSVRDCNSMRLAFRLHLLPAPPWHGVLAPFKTTRKGPFQTNSVKDKWVMHFLLSVNVPISVSMKLT